MKRRYFILTALAAPFAALAARLTRKPEVRFGYAGNIATQAPGWSLAALPDTAEARLSILTEWIEAGVIDADSAKRLLEVP